MKKLLLLALFVMFAVSVSAENRNIRGRIISEDLEAVMGLSVCNSDTLELGRTDHKGCFEVIVPDGTEKLLLFSLGMEPATVYIPTDCDCLEIVIMYDVIYDFITARRVNKLRKKRYEQLPEIHKQAYERGIFSSESTCVFIEFKEY